MHAMLRKFALKLIFSSIIVSSCGILFVLILTIFGISSVSNFVFNSRVLFLDLWYLLVACIFIGIVIDYALDRVQIKKPLARKNFLLWFALGFISVAIAVALYFVFRK